MSYCCAASLPRVRHTVLVGPSVHHHAVLCCAVLAEGRRESTDSACKSAAVDCCPPSLASNRALSCALACSRVLAQSRCKSPPMDSHATLFSSVRPSAFRNIARRMRMRIGVPGAQRVACGVPGALPLAWRLSRRPSHAQLVTPPAGCAVVTDQGRTKFYNCKFYTVGVSQATQQVLSE